MVRPYDCALIDELLGTPNSPGPCAYCAGAHDCALTKALFGTAYVIVSGHPVNAPHALAQDVVQDALLKARQHALTLRAYSDDRIRAWLYLTVKNLARNAVKKHGNRIPTGAPPPEQPDSGMSPSDVAEYEEQYHMLEETLNTLPHNQVVLWRLKYNHRIKDLAELTKRYNEVCPPPVKSPAEIAGLLKKTERQVIHMVRRRLISEWNVEHDFVRLCAICLQVSRAPELSQEQLKEQINNACPRGHPKGKFRQPLVSYFLAFHRLTSTREADEPYLNALSCFLVRFENDCLTKRMVAEITAYDPRMDTMKAQRYVNDFWAEVKERVSRCHYQRGNQ